MTLALYQKNQLMSSRKFNRYNFSLRFRHESITPDCGLNGDPGPPSDLPVVCTDSLPQISRPRSRQSVNNEASLWITRSIDLVLMFVPPPSPHWTDWRMQLRTHLPASRPGHAWTRHSRTHPFRVPPHLLCVTTRPISAASLLGYASTNCCCMVGGTRWRSRTVNRFSVPAAFLGENMA